MNRDVLQVTTLVPVGDQLALMIGREWLDRLGIAGDTPLEITMDGDNLVIHPVGNDHRTQVIEAARNVMEIHAETLKKLAQ